MKKFLIADDSDLKREFLAVMVKRSKLEAEILIAKTTDAAIDLINTQDDISYGFIDYEMPTQNGPVVIRALRIKFPDAKIALVTSADSEEYERDGREAGANEFICTSLQSDEVEAKIKDTLEGWGTF